MNEGNGNMEIRTLSVIDWKNGRAVVSGSSCELTEFLNHAELSSCVQKFAREKGIPADVVKAIFVESSRLLKLLKPLHVVTSVANEPL